MGLRERSKRWYYRFRLNGEQFEGSTGLEATRQNLNAAKTIEAEKRLEISKGNRPQASKGIPFNIGAQEFLLWCHGTEYRKKPNSAKRISGSFRSLLDFFGKINIGAIQPIDIERFKTYRSTVHHVKDVTLRNDLNALSLLFRYAVRAKWCNNNPLLGDNKVKRPSGDDAIRIHVITTEEEASYFARARGNLADLAKLILLQGPRPEEILAAKKTAYDSKRGTLRIEGGKTNAARRDLFLCSESIEIIERRLKEQAQRGSQWLFRSTRNRKGDYHIVQMHTPHDSACLDAGVAFVIYDFRHTFATRYVHAGGDLPSLAAILGHSGLRAVMKYVHPSADHQRAGMKQYEERTRPPRLALMGKKKA